MKKVVLRLRLMTEMQRRTLHPDTIAILKQINSLRVTGLADYLNMLKASDSKAAATIFGKPYIDDGDIRTFDVTIDDCEYVWHRDEEDRLIEILSGDGWQFQPDGCLPLLLKPGI